MILVGLFAIHEGIKHNSTTFVAIGCLAVLGGGYYTLQWFRAKSRDERDTNRKKK
jgi:hypothetical protein